MVRQSRSRAIMIALTLTATAALGTVARTAAQGITLLQPAAHVRSTLR